jgi:hypothetical protein
MEYDFPDDDFLGYTQTRIADFTFPDSGRVLMIAQWWNKCVSQDTFMFRRLDICKPIRTSSVVYLNKPEPKVIAIYDMMGRKLDAIKEDEIMIYLYDDGSTKKVIQH